MTFIVRRQKALAKQKRWNRKSVDKLMKDKYQRKQEKVLGFENKDLLKSEREIKVDVNKT